MSDDHLDAFVRESETRIRELNNALLALEDEPDDEEAIDRVFRTAHTLKGNFGAMGYHDAADLAHAVEDLLDAVRQGEIEPTPALMDEVFAGVDRIEAVVAEIGRSGGVESPVEDRVRALRAVLDDDATDGGDDDATDGDDATDDDDATLDSHHRVAVTLAETEMPGVDAMLALETAGAEHEVVGTEPARERVEDGEFEDGFEATVAAPDPDAAVAAFESARQVATAAAVGGTTTEDGGETTERTGDGAEDGDGADADAGDDAAGGEGGGPDLSTGEIGSVRVDVDQLDDLYGMVEQLVTSRIKLRQAVDGADDRLDELDKVTTSLQNTVMDMRLIPVERAVSTFPRLVRDLARDLDKEVDLRMEGTDVELDRSILDEISDPLMHVVRNAVDHGIEPPAEREAAGKPRTGTVTLRAERTGDRVSIAVGDDGAGLDPAAIRDTAVEEGVHDRETVAAMTDSEVFELIHHPGLSTSTEVTDVSGRGVGMDVVRSTARRLDGDVSVESTPGEGTTVTVELPVSMAIVKVLFVVVGGRSYGVPIKAVDEVSRGIDVETVRGEPVVEHDDRAYPLIDLREALAVGRLPAGDGDGSPAGDERGPAAADGGSAAPSDGDDGDRSDERMYVRVRESVREVVLSCDAVSGQEEVVVKPFQGRLGDTPGLSGTAVVGDGEVVPIVDVGSL